jgi:transcriptional regulator with XRE-family HTH domain
MNLDLAAKIRKARREARLTQKQLAEKLGIEAITVSRWERGVTHPSVPTLERIAWATETRLRIELVRQAI